MAEALGVAENTVRRWEIGEYSPDPDMLLRIVRLLGTTVATLYGETVSGSDTIAPVEYALGPIGDDESKSQGGVICHVNTMKMYGIDPDRVAVCTKSDDAMAPTIRPSSVLFFDLDQIDPKGFGIFVFEHDGYRQCRRLQQRNGSVVIISDNPIYERYEIPADHITIVGRVGLIVTPI